MAKSSTPKYRPVLSAQLILHMLDLAKADMSAASIELIGILAPFKAKIDNLSIAPAYNTKPKQSLEDSLGMDTGTVIEGEYELDGVSYNFKEDYWKACFDKLTEKGPKFLSIVELNAANEHRYLQGLMTEEEVKVFEADMFKQGD